MGYDFKKIKDKIKGAADVNKNPKEFACEVLFAAFWIFAVILIVIAILDLRLNLTPCFCIFTGDLDSARYLLSAIAQAQAAIIALVVTLTLVAVQLASQSYSPRVMDLFRSFRNYPFWLLLMLYFVSIMYDVVVLGSLNNGMSELPVNRISYAVFLTGFAVAALIPYTRNVINNLKPENVIKQIIGRINRKDIKEFVGRINKTVEEKKKESIFYTYHPRDLEGGTRRIVPVVDIIKRAIKEDDITTSREGIREIEKNFEYVFSLKELIRGNEENIVRHFCYHFETIGDRAVFREDEDSTIEICRALNKICVLAAGKKLSLAIFKVANSLEKIGVLAAGKKQENVIKEVAHSFRNIIFTICEVDDEEMNRVTRGVIRSLGKVIIAATKKELRIVASIAISCLGDAGQKVAENGIPQATSEAAVYLRKIGVVAAEKGMDDVIKETVYRLEHIGVEVIGKIPVAGFNVVNSLGTIGLAVAEKRMEDTTCQVVDSLCELGRISIQRKERRNNLIENLSKIYAAFPEMVEKGIANYESDLKIECDESKLKSFQQFKNQLTFLK